MKKYPELFSMRYIITIIITISMFIVIIVIPQINISGFVQPTITSKFIYFTYSCLVLLVLSIIKLMNSGRAHIRVSKLDFAFFVLLCIILLNRYVVAPQVGFSLRFLELLGLSVVYLIVRNLSVKIFPWLLLAIVISGIWQAIYGNLQLLGYYASNHSGFKMTGSFFNPGPYAGFLVSVWGISLGMYLFKEIISILVQNHLNSNSTFLNTLLQYTFEYIPLVGIIATVLVLPASQSRAAWLAILCSSAILLEFRYKVVKKVLKKLSVAKIVVGSFLSVCILFAGLYAVYHFKKGSSDGRLFIWKVTSEIIKEAPAFGVGFDRFKAYYMNSQAHYFAKNGETPEALVADNTYYAFNEWLQFIAENGFTGFIFLVIILIVLYKIKVKDENMQFSVILKTSLLAIGVFASFSYPMQILPVKLIVIFLLAYSARLDFNTKELKIFQHGNNKNIKWVLKSTVLVVGVIIISKGVLYTKELADGFKNWKIALNTYQYGDYENAIKEYEAVYPIFKEDGEFLMNYGKTLSMAKEYTKAVSILEQAKHHLNTTILETALGDSYKATKQYDKAEMAYQHAANMIPSRFYPNYLLAKLYDERGQIEKAVIKAQELMKKEVKIPSTAIKEIRVEMKKIIEKY